MRIFKTKWFTKFAEKETLNDSELKEIAQHVENGQAVNLGGDVFKIRLARPGKGKSGGYRVILFFRQGNKTFFEYAYPKSKRDNIDDDELKNFKQDAKLRFSLTSEQLETQVRSGKLTEIV